MKKKKIYRIVPLKYDEIRWSEIYLALNKTFRKHHAKPVVQFFQKNSNQFVLWKDIEGCQASRICINEQLRQSGTSYRLCAHRRYKRNKNDTTQKWKIGKSIEM